MKIKVNHRFKIKDFIPHDPSKSLWQSVEDAGGKSMDVAGMIGQGSKIHEFHILYLDTDDGIGICSVMSFCGSAKFRSHIRPIFDDAFVVNCKKCLR